MTPAELRKWQRELTADRIEELEDEIKRLKQLLQEFQTAETKEGHKEKD